MEELIMLLLAFCLPSLASSRDYHFVRLEKNWAEAQIYCRENFLDLATVDNADDWAKVSHTLADLGFQDAWIGLYDDVTSWRWSLNDTSLYEGEKAFLKDWFDFDNADGSENCGFISTTVLGDIDCAISSRHSLCYDEPSNSYHYVSTHSNWKDAQSHCRRTFTDLASVRNQQEKDAITSLLPNVPSWQHWVGLFRDGWKWSDQSGSSFRAWRDGEPGGGDKSCGSAGADGWRAALCSLRRPFICTAPKRMIFKMTLNTTADPNDPLVQEAIMKHVEKLLSEQGLEHNVKLKWRKQANGKVFNTTMP